MNYIPVAAAFIVIGMAVGLFVFFYPVSIMRMQVKLFEKINWRIELISLQKEFTRIKYTGLYLVLLCLFAVVYIWYFLK